MLFKLPVHGISMHGSQADWDRLAFPQQNTLLEGNLRCRLPLPCVMGMPLQWERAMGFPGFLLPSG